MPAQGYILVLSEYIQEITQNERVILVNQPDHYLRMR